MRRVAFLIISMLFMVAGCGGGSDRAFADIVWQVRCPADVSVGCPQDAPAREVNNLDGEEDFTISCAVDQENETQWLLNFRIDHDDNVDEPFGVRAQNVLFTNTGAVVGTGCSVTVRESGNTYRGGCSSSPPSTAMPCQMTTVAVAADSMTGQPTLTANMLCRNLQNEAGAGLHRDVTQAGNGGGAEDMPFPIRLVNCDGLVLPD